MSKIKLLSLSEVRALRASRVHLRSYQSLEPPKDTEFALDALFALRGVSKPSDRQYTYMRHWLTDNLFIQSRIHGRKEFWIYEPNLTPDQKRKIQLRYPFHDRYTVNSFVNKFYPGVSLPIPRAQEYVWEKIMRSHGLRPRMHYLYWSLKLRRRATLRNPHPPAKGPAYVKFPSGSFCLWDLLEVNKLARTPENFAWALRAINKHGAKRIHGSHRYAKPDQTGRMPATITGLWELPHTPVFTTYQFQILNNARKPSNEEWQRAIDFLRANGYIFDPKWKRWRKSPDLEIYQSTLNSRAEIAGRK